MNRKNRLILIGAASACGLLALIGLSALYALQTNWFKNKLRERIIAAVENASGGRVEIAAFNYDWRTLTAEFQGFVVHGTEPSSAPSLFEAESVRIGLKIASVLKRDVDIDALVVERPEIYLLVRPDGTTNIPSPKVRQSASKTVAELLNLRIRHFEFNHGSIEAEMRRVPLNIQGKDVSVVVSYEPAAPGYEARVSSKDVRFKSEVFGPLLASLDASAQLQRNRVMIRQLAVTSKGSKLQASGIVQPFTHPIVDLKLDGQLDASAIAPMAELADLLSGNLMLSGKAHYDESTLWIFQGKAVGRNLIYRSNSLALKNASFESDVFAKHEEVKFTHLELTAPDGKLSGQAVLKDFRELQLEGNLSRFDIRTVASLVSNRALSWSGIGSGPVHLRATLNRRASDLTVQSNLQITSARGGIPVSGNVDVSYSKRGDVLQFGNSHLEFPGTQLSFSGILGSNLQIALNSTNLDDLKPGMPFSTARITLPVLLQNGRAHFDGTLAGPLANPRVQGNIALSHFRMEGQTWDQARSHIDLSMSAVDFSSFSVDQGSLHAAGDAHLGLNKSDWEARSPVRLNAQFRGANVAKMVSEYSTLKLPIMEGIASGSIDVSGSLDEPQGSARIRIDNADAYGERLNQIQIFTTLSPDQVRITRGVAQAGPALLSFSGAYDRAPGSWRDGELRLKVDSNGFPLASLAPVRKYEPGLNAQFEIHGEGAARIAAGHIEPKDANGTLALRNVTVSGVPYGSITVNAVTRGQTLNTTFTGDLRESHLGGSAQIQLVPGNPAKGEFHLDRIQFGTLYALLNAGQIKALPFDGFLQGGFSFEGPLRKLDQLRASVRLQEVQLSSTLPGQTAYQAKPADLIFRSVEPIALDVSNGVATVRSFHIAGKDTSLSVAGSIPFLRQAPITLSVNGAVDLRIFQLFDPNVQSSGQSLIAASIGGTFSNPSANGTLNLRNGSFFLNNVSNGLSEVNGTVKFDRDRATIEKLTAHSGGGEISLSGFASFAAGHPIVYRLEGNAESVRVRYAGGISATASSDLRLTGTSENGLLSGTVTVSRVVFNPNTDVGTVLASLAAPAAAPANENDFLTGLQMDVRVESAPNLLLSTALSRDVEAEIDLRLRGTPDHPVLLGTVAANEGDIKVFGTKYSINRGEVTFANTVKIEPVLDLDLQTEARGIIVDVTVSGTLGKLNINYRSDPPLQPRDIIALLTVGRTPNRVSNIPNAQVTNDVSALQSGASTVLGQAISPASNRLSKLFGITNIKIDPMVQGITNTPQARLTIEQQISREITVTYVTNLSQTSEQIFRLEYAFSRQYSLVALRDDNGEFGIDIQYKKRFK